MSKFTKFNNPNKRRRKPIPKYSPKFMEEQREELRKALAESKTPTEELNIIKAFNITCFK